MGGISLLSLSCKEEFLLRWVSFSPLIYKIKLPILLHIKSKSKTQRKKFKTRCWSVSHSWYMSLCRNCRNYKEYLIFLKKIIKKSRRAFCSSQHTGRVQDKHDIYSTCKMGGMCVDFLLGFLLQSDFPFRHCLLYHLKNLCTCCQ